MIDRLKRQLAEDGLTTFMLKVRPQAQITRFRGPLGTDVFKIDVAAPPEDGKANDEVVRFLAEEFGVKKSQVEILSGQTSKQKVIRITTTITE